MVAEGQLAVVEGKLWLQQNKGGGSRWLGQKMVSLDGCRNCALGRM